MRDSTPRKRRPRPAAEKTGASAAIRVVDLPDLIYKRPKLHRAAPPKVEPGPALRVVAPRRRFVGPNGLASWPVVGAVVGLTCVWLVGGVAAAWGLSQWVGTAEVAVAPAPEPPAEPASVAPVIPVAPVAPPVVVKPTVDPADDRPGAAKSGPTPPPSVASHQIPAATVSTDADTIAALLAKMPQQPAVCDPKAKTVTCGTAVNLIDDPERAAKEAVKEHKLLFVIHLAGNLEEARFT
jgi:hypothetical protein